jgi:hypothetical protein
MKILGSLVFILSSVWLLAVQAHPLLVLFQRGGHPPAVLLGWLRPLPYPPPFGDSWWPVLCGFIGVLVGAALVVASRPRIQTIETIEINER